MKTLLLATFILTTAIAGAQTLVKDIAPGPFSGYPTNFLTMNGITYFIGNDSVHGAELWRTDGTSDGTYMVKDICPGTYSGLEYNYDDAFFSSLNQLGNDLYFFADADSVNYALWKSDGTEGGTLQVSYISMREENINEYMTPMGNYLYFIADDTLAYPRSQLWRTDGTTGGTMQVTDSAMNTQVNNISLVDGNTLYFTADSGFSGVCLFKTDGTKQGTNFLLDSRSDVFDPSYYWFVKYNGSVYFTTTDVAHGGELWITDGTAAGTHLAVDILPGPQGSGPYRITVFNNKMVFQAYNDTVGTELFISDGTTQGTGVLKDIWPGGGPNQSSFPDEFTVYNSKLYFVANDSVHGQELWVSDGTTNGTQLFYDINTATNSDYGKSSIPDNMTVVNGLLYFSAYDSIHADEPWVTDGTPEGTHLLMDICPGACYSNPFGFTGNGPMMFFDATTQDLGYELYRIGEPSGITEVVEPVKFKLQPNPAEDHVTIITDESFIGGTTQVIDITGRIVFMLSNEASTYQLNTSTLPKGMYLIKLTSKHGEIGVEKLVVE